MDSDSQRRYLRAMGVDVYARREAPGAVDGTGQIAAEQTSESEQALPEGLKHEPPPVNESAVAAAPAAQVMSMGWTELAEVVRGCTRCGLRAGCTQTVFGVGPTDARLLVVGEGPGADEDRLGEPFVGRAGKLLDEMLFAIGHARVPKPGQQGVYIANVVKCRPPKNRDPQPDESAACRPYLERQIALLKPRAILAVGRIAAQLLLGTSTPIGKLRGEVHQYGDAAIPMLVTYHPAYLLRSPREKRKVWADLCALRTLLNESAGG